MMMRARQRLPRKARGRPCRAVQAACITLMDMLLPIEGHPEAGAVAGIAVVALFHKEYV